MKRSATTAQRLADELRAKLVQEPAYWSAIRRPRRHEYRPELYTIAQDDRRLPLAERDPRAIETEYSEARLLFWSAETAGEVRIAALRARTLARHLAECAVHA